MAKTETTAAALRWQAEAKTILPEHTLMMEAADEMVRLRKFVQWVADHSNDPAVVQEARRHGAE